MKKARDPRIIKAEYRAVNEEGLDYVIDSCATPDYVEVVGKMGGDTITYRFYNDGRVGEK